MLRRVSEVVQLAVDCFVALFKALGGGWPPDETLRPSDVWCRIAAARPG